MAAIKVILWVGIGLAIAFHVLATIIEVFKENSTDMAKKERDVSKVVLPEATAKLMEDVKYLDTIEESGILRDKAEKRLKLHYAYFEQLLKGNPKAKWSIAEITDPQRLANKVVELINEDDYRTERDELVKRLNDFPEKRRDLLLKHIKFLIQLAEEDGNFERTVDLERIKLERDLQRIQTKLAEKDKLNAAFDEGDGV